MRCGLCYTCFLLDGEWFALEEGCKWPPVISRYIDWLVLKHCKILWCVKKIELSAYYDVDPNVVTVIEVDGL